MRREIRRRGNDEKICSHSHALFFDLHFFAAIFKRRLCITDGIVPTVFLFRSFGLRGYRAFQLVFDGRGMAGGGGQ